MRKNILALIILLPLSLLKSQELQLEDCYAKAIQNYPLAKQRELISKSSEYTIDNISKGYLPQASLNGQATYQSDVIKLPINIPGVHFTPISKDQYRIYGEVVEPITDLLTIKTQKDYAKNSAKIQDQSIETELYKLKERINQLYFGILLIDEQTAQLNIIRNDLQNGLKKVSAANINGLATKTDIDKFQVELLNLKQKETELINSKRAFLDMLSLFINQQLDENTKLEKPVYLSTANDISRPELLNFELQKNNLTIQRKLITAKTLPHLSAFFQGGYGRPNPVNMLSNDFKSYYITGLRLYWNFTTLYTSGKEKKLLDINSQLIDVQKETFLFNTRFALKQQNKDAEKLQELLQTDKEIVTLRTSIKEATSAQLENGVATSTDYLKDLNAEDQAKQQELLHQVQLLMTQYSIKTTSGN